MSACLLESLGLVCMRVKVSSICSVTRAAADIELNPWLSALSQSQLWRAQGADLSQH